MNAKNRFTENEILLVLSVRIVTVLTQSWQLRVNASPRSHCRDDAEDHQNTRHLHCEVLVLVCRNWDGAMKRILWRALCKFLMPNEAVWWCEVIFKCPSCPISSLNRGQFILNRSWYPESCHYSPRAMTYKSNEYSTGLFNWRFVEARGRWQDYLQPPHSKHSIVIDASDIFYKNVIKILFSFNPAAVARRFSKSWQ